MSNHPPIWYFDKVAGAIVVVTGIGLILLSLVMGYVWIAAKAPMFFLGIILFVLLCAAVCLYTGVTLLRRSGQA